MEIGRGATLLLAATGLATVYGLVSNQTAQAAGQHTAPLTSQRAPEITYKQTCGYCHGANVGPVILGRKIPAQATQMMVRSGLNAMPAFRPSEISPQELDALARWIQSSKVNPAEKGK